MKPYEPTPEEIERECEKLRELKRNEPSPTVRKVDRKPNIRVIRVDYRTTDGAAGHDDEVIE